jgi:hypothetical protein
MRIKIKGDGTSRGTEVFDYLTDKKIHRISRLFMDWNAYQREGLIEATMELQPLEVEMDAYVKEIRIGNTIYRPVDETVDTLRSLLNTKEE